MKIYILNHGATIKKFIHNDCHSYSPHSDAKIFIKIGLNILYLRGLMKTPSQDLFHLIKSLSKTEKRYFKKFAELHGKEDNNYLLLFDAIVEQKEFNEQVLKTQFQGQAFLRQLPVAKNYLYSKILDAMESFHRDSSIHSSVRRNIFHAELLQKKGLYDQSMKLLHKAKRDATEFDLFHALIEIYTHWEFNAYIEKYDLPELEKLHDKAVKTTLLMNDAIMCRNLSLQMVNLFNHYYQTRNNKFLSQGEKLMKNPFFKNVERIKTLSGKLRIYEAKFFFWYGKGNLNAACNEGEKAVRLCLSSPVHMKNNIKFYMVLLSNIFYVRSEQKKYDEAYDCLTKIALTSSHAQSHSLRAKYFYLYDSALLHYLYHTGKFKELEKELLFVIGEIEIHKDEMSDFEKIGMFMNIAISFFYIGNLKQSMHYQNILRNEFDLSVNPEAQYFLNIFYLITHYDSGHHEILPYLVKPFTRFIKKRSHVSEVEAVMVDLLKKTPHSASDKTHRKDALSEKEEFTKVKKNIENLPIDKVHHYIFKYFDLISWLESKIRNKSFQEIIIEKK